MYQVSAGVRSCRNEDGGIVLDIAQGQMFRLNPVGAQILEFLSNGLVEADIAREIARKYAINEERALKDVREFLKCLEDQQLVQVATK
jgi:hypothetical protein